MIHKYSLNGYNIILDVYSGAVHVVDDLTYRLVDFTNENMTEQTPAEAYEALGDYSREEIDSAYAELCEAFDMGQLHAADDYEKFADMMINASVKSMCLNISHDCNLACEYCFASKGGFGGERCLMSEEIARKAIDFLIERSVNTPEARKPNSARISASPSPPTVCCLTTTRSTSSTARCTTAFSPSTDARKSMTVCASTGAARAATTGFCRNSKN